MPGTLEFFHARLSKALAPHGAVSEFCRKTGFSRASVDRWLDPKDPTPPAFESIDKIADALGTTAWQLIGPERVQAMSARTRIIELLVNLDEAEARRVLGALERGIIPGLAPIADPAVEVAQKQKKPSK